MFLNLFSVSNYRSIEKAHRVQCSNRTVIIGKNNEGKSNILRALNCSMEILKNHNTTLARRATLGYSAYLANRLGFNWERDYPIGQTNTSKFKTEFYLEFEMTDQELSTFNRRIGVSINGGIGIKITLKPDTSHQIVIVKKGPNSKKLTEKKNDVVQYIIENVDFIYIPAIRTETDANRIVSEMVSSRLREAEAGQEYIDAVKKISDIQKPIFVQIQKDITKPLKQFLPTIKKININISNENRRDALRRGFDIVIDDGTATSLEYKGDGVKSLITLALLQNRARPGKSSILAIEEPESHLHPGAIHQLNDIINRIALNSQILLTTHNPLFVDRTSISSNVIISDGEVKQATKISDIRNTLGILASDNLVAANLVLVVEGHDDAKSFRALLSSHSGKLRIALQQNLLAIDSLTGASKLPYKLQTLRNALTNYYAVLDNDQAGIQAFGQAKVNSLLSEKFTTMITCQGLRESEFEDMLNFNVYKGILNEYGVSITRPIPGSDKWSTRVGKLFRENSKPFNDATKEEIKWKIALEVERDPQNALNQSQSSSFRQLVTSLESALSNIQ